jgi:hypothetical protein
VEGADGAFHSLAKELEIFGCCLFRCQLHFLEEVLLFHGAIVLFKGQFSLQVYFPLSRDKLHFRLMIIFCLFILLNNRLINLVQLPINRLKLLYHPFDLTIQLVPFF